VFQDCLCWFKKIREYEELINWMVTLVFSICNLLFDWVVTDRCSTWWIWKHRISNNILENTKYWNNFTKHTSCSLVHYVLSILKVEGMIPQRHLKL
jgi:hypothetical protein